MISIAKPIIGKSEEDAVIRVLRSGQLAAGPKVAEFENAIAKLCKAKYAIAFSSGTTALHAALYAAKINEGAEVITTPFTFVATANSILMQRGKVVFADIDEHTFNLDPKRAAEKITKRTEAIIGVDLYGQPYDYDELKKIAGRHSLRLIEDACQAIGATYKKRMAGTLGDVGVFSFYATKNLTTGEGGMLITNRKDLAERAKMFRHHGQKGTHYRYFDLGYNYRTTDMQAAIGLAQLKKLKKFTQRRIENAKYLTELVKNTPGIITPKIAPNRTHVFHQYTIRVTKGYELSRDQLKEHLEEKGVGTSIFYPIPLHLHPHFKKLGYKRGDFPVAEQIAKEVLSLPIHPLVNRHELKYIAEVIKEI